MSKLPRFNLLSKAQVRKMGQCARAYPQGETTFRHSVLQFIHDQRGLLRSIYVQQRLIARDCDPDFCPLARNQIHIALVHLRKFFAQPLPGKLRHRYVLRAVVPLHLVFGAAVLWPQIETLVRRSVRSYPKGDSGEAAKLRCGSRFRVAGEVDFDGSIPKLRTGKDSKPRSISEIGSPGVHHPEGFPALVLHGFRGYIPKLEFAGGL